MSHSSQERRAQETVAAERDERQQAARRRNAEVRAADIEERQRRNEPTPKVSIKTVNPRAWWRAHNR